MFTQTSTLNAGDMPTKAGERIEWNDPMLILPRQPQILALFDEIREGLGTGDMSLNEMVSEMRQIRET